VVNKWLPWLITLGGVWLLSKSSSTRGGSLTKDFTLDEFAPDAGTKAFLTPTVIKNIEALAKNVLQPARNKVGVPIRITSGVRTPTHNAAIGGASGSQHTFGMAVDIQPIPATNANYKKLFDAIKSGTYDQLIWENATYPTGVPSHLHVSYVRPNSGNPLYKTNRKQKLLYLNGNYSTIV